MSCVELQMKERERPWRTHTGDTLQDVRHHSSNGRGAPKHNNQRGQSDL